VKQGGESALDFISAILEVQVNRIRPLLLTITLLSCSNFSYAQLWSGVLAPSRAVNWANAGATITNRTTQCGSTIAAYGSSGSPASASTINTAISSCAAGDYVQLGAGTFYLNTSINVTTSNVTLRGMGPDQTLLVFSGTSTNCDGFGPITVCIHANANDASQDFIAQSGTTTSWTGPYAAGSTQLTFSSTSNLQVGSLVVLYQQDDSSDPGNLYVCATTGSDGTCSESGQGGTQLSGYGETQTVQVTNISGTTVTITPGVYAPNWVSGKTPKAWWMSSYLPITGFGIENLSIDTTNETVLGFSGLQFYHAYNCWGKNLRVVNGTSGSATYVNHISTAQSDHITVRDSYIYGSGSSSEGYGFEVGVATADSLFENNISQHIATGFLNEGSGPGNVFGYNYAVDNFYNAGGGAPQWQQADGFHHDYWEYYTLFEGHEGIDYIGDDIHGTGDLFTHFRCYLTGYDPATVDYSGTIKSLATFAYFPMAYERYNNLVGSVLGTYTHHTKYISYPATNTTCGNQTTSASSVIVAGYSDQAGVMFAPASGDAIVNCTNGPGSFVIYDDPSIYNGTNTGNMMLWGNYAACNGDSNCNAVRWQASENASGASTYPGLSNPSETLPASFYYSSKPAWWPYNIPWPPIGPDVSGGTIANVGGHVYLTPAANCYLNILGGKTDGSTGLLTFNANSCLPAPATNVQAAGH
jgi:hypothetical protein